MTKTQRKRERFKRQFHSDEYAEFVGTLPCLSCGRHATERRPNVMHHDPTRGAGGTWKDTSPLCNDCHTMGRGARHTVGVKTFWDRVGMTYQEANERTQRAWEAFSVA